MESPRDTVYPWGIWSPFYSALNIVFGAPAGYCVPVGINDIKILTF